jgi:CBS domain-containing protein
MVATLDRLRSLRVADVMSREVVVIQAHQTMEEAARVLGEHQISGAPVIDEHGKCVGILSAGDFVSRARAAGRLVSTVAACEKALAREAPGGPWQIADVFDDRVVARLTPAVQTVTPQAALGEAARMMCAQHVHRLPVLDSWGRPVGMITATDIVAALVQVVDEADQRSGKGRLSGTATGSSLRSTALEAAIGELRCEHAGLQKQIDAVRTAIENQEDPARLVAALEAFARRTEEHFRQEETGECFSQACSRAPWLAERIAALLAQHARLREQLQEVVRLASRPPSRAKLAERFNAFATLWLAHETAENDLLQDAYNQDLGTKD